MAKDPRIDRYIEKAQPFAQPVLNHIRKLIHKAIPQVQETIKWGMPSFEYNGPLAGLASFKQHCVLGFWKAPLIKDTMGYLGKNKANGGAALGNLGRITSLDDLPPDTVVLDFLRQAKKLNDDNIKVTPQVAKENVDLLMPDYFTRALKRNKSVWRNFESFPPGKRKDYIKWLLDAKTDATREKRLETAVEWISEGKSRNWKYERKKISGS